ncbi:MAG: vWA domain-containing protein [Pseudomonadota bacterium]
MRQWSALSTVGIALLVSGCSSSADSQESGAPAGRPVAAAHDDGSTGAAPPSDPSAESDAPGKSSDSDSSDFISASSPASPSAGTGVVGQQAAAGALTAGAWDDNRNFSRFLGYRSGLAALGLPGLLAIEEDELNAAHQLWLTVPTAKQALDISLIIDTTGSMGDEIAYLQAEFLTLSKAIAVSHPDAQQRWSLVLYKDLADEYITEQFDFSSNTQDFVEHLAAASAGGGGDTPESPDRGLAVAQQLAWSSQSSAAKLAFWVADAPHHEDKAEAMANAIRGMRQLGVHIYPIASSGVDELTEVTMRTAAALTGGRYLFLTNDSGIGNDHKEPTIPCYFVTKLDVAIERMVDIELSGVYREPDASQVVRTGGDPKDGACQLDSGESVLVF